MAKDDEAFGQKSSDGSGKKLSRVIPIPLE
jgi:hypothetical protein